MARTKHLQDDAVDKAIARDVSAISAQDPETVGQWNLLRMRIAQSAPAGSEVRAGIPRLWFKPALASVLGAAAIVVAVSLFRTQPAQPLVYQTGAGQRSSVLLPDSTEVILNHTSALAVDRQRSGDDRHATLTGEAFFKVRKTGLPFIVTTDLGSVRVLGTEFNVRLRRGMMEVAVVSGRVRVTASREGKDSTVLLQGGEFTAFDRGAYPASPQRLPYIDEYPGWIHDKFIFQRATLESATREIAEQFGSTISIGNPELLNQTITGVVDGRSLEAAVRTLCLLSGTSYRNENSGYILY
jgi:transmembrane sensor